MRIHKRIAALVFATALLAGGVFYSVSGTSLRTPQTVSAAGVQDLELERGDTPNESIIKKCSQSASGFLDIPRYEPYEGSEIVGIETEAFAGCKELTAIYLPESIKTIGEKAFSECKSLTMINIPEGVEEIPRGCFEVCENLSEVTLHSGVRKIGGYAFGGCKLHEIEIPDTVVFIEENAFIGCDEIEVMTFMNPQCTISGLGTVPGKIRGYSGSSAERLATANNIPFEAIDDTPAPGEPVFCDANGDGKVTALDAQFVLQYYLESLLGETPSWKEITGNENAPS